MRMSFCCFTVHFRVYETEIIALRWIMIKLRSLFLTKFETENKNGRLNMMI